MRPTPLPPNSFTPDSAHHHAYKRCLNLESNSKFPNAESKKNPHTPPIPILAARILGYLLREIPTLGGKDSFAGEVNSCVDDGEMRQLAQLYLHHFILAFKRNHAGVTPVPSDHSSRSSFDEQRETYSEMLEAASLNHSTAKKKALIRDHYRCNFTGHYDIKIREDGELSSWYDAHRGEFVPSHTDAVHIIPESTNHGVFQGAFKHEWASVWAVLSRFSDNFQLPDGLNGGRIHRLENIVTMDPALHRSFDSLQVWLEKTDVPNKYRLRSIDDDAMVRKMCNPIVFTSTDPKYPVPSPEYIGLHATCAKVANLSGAAEYVELIWRDMEDMQVLSTDGSSSKLLSFALAQAATDVAAC